MTNILFIIRLLWYMFSENTSTKTAAIEVIGIRNFLIPSFLFILAVNDLNVSMSCMSFSCPICLIVFAIKSSISFFCASILHQYYISPFLRNTAKTAFRNLVKHLTLVLLATSALFNPINSASASMEWRCQ